MADFAGGDGSEGDPYQISTVDHLQNVGSYLDAGTYFILINDIDASATTGWNGGAGFNPIGIGSSFNGHFDGQGYGIVALFINRGATDYVAIFSNASTASTIQNVRINDADITGDDYIGVLIALSYGTVYNCHSYTCTVNADYYSGGLIGYTYGASSNITYCSSIDNTVNCNHYSGGFLGYMYRGGAGGYNTLDHCWVKNIDITGWGSYIGGFVGSIINQSGYRGQITNCYVEGGTVKNSYYVGGGFVGYVNNSDFRDCWTDVLVRLDRSGAGGSYGNAGGFVGIISVQNHPWDTNNATRISGCYSLGDVYHFSYPNGGFAADVYAGGYLNDCYSRGDTYRGSGSTATACCGFLGYLRSNCEAINTYSTGKVIYFTAANPTNKGWGQINANAIASGCFWDKEESEQSTSPNGIGKTTKEMKDIITYLDAGYDFDNIWNQRDINNTYPILRKIEAETTPGIHYDPPYETIGRHPIGLIQTKRGRIR